MPKFVSKGKQSRFTNESEWAAAVVRKAMPQLVKALSEAAELLGQPAPVQQPNVVTLATEEPQDESLAALLLRLLRAEENTGKENSKQRAAAIKENSSVV